MMMLLVPWLCMGLGVSILVALKLSGAVALPWLIVLLPIWIYPLFWIVVAVAYLAVLAGVLLLFGLAAIAIGLISALTGLRR